MAFEAPPSAKDMLNNQRQMIQAAGLIKDQKKNRSDGTRGSILGKADHSKDESIERKPSVAFN